jgi:hypothetical protein
MTSLLKNLGYDLTSLHDTEEVESSFDIADICITELSTEPNTYTISWNGSSWKLTSKIVLDAKDIKPLACIAARFAPPNSTVNLQADTHGAGNVYVGMIMSFDACSIPIHLVSGDIGCGLSIVPLVKDSIHSTEDTIEKDKTEEYHSVILATMRRSLKRGKAAEDGAFLSVNIHEAIEFYGNMELLSWLDEMRYILTMLDIPWNSRVSLKPPSVTETNEEEKEESAVEKGEEKEEEIYGGLTREQTTLLQYIGRFSQSLGSSGNHFMELSVDEKGYYWLVVHSGSRGLGAKVYEPIAKACRRINRGFEIATGPLAIFYTRAYDALNKFAKLNRIMCAISVLKDLRYDISAVALQTAMRQSFMFAPAMEAVKQDAEAMLSLMSGLTHNGLKAFVNNTTHEVLFVLSKGAIAMTKRASASIVALRAGDGCYVWTLADTTCNWIEEDIQIAVQKVQTGGYHTVHSSPDIIYSGHGAGRARATTQTAKISSFKDVVKFYEETGIVGNVAPGLLGDNPRIAYNDVATIVKHLPLDIACTKSWLKTRVSYKEGITFISHSVKACAVYIQNVWDVSSETRKLWLDLNVCARGMTKQNYTTYSAERDKIYDTLAEKWGISTVRNHVISS